MDIISFAKLRPYLYHLTDRENFKQIAKDNRLISTTVIAEQVDHPDSTSFLRTKRPSHVKMQNGTTTYIIRDQKPISEVVLRRSLENGCSYEDFLYLLNSRVFFWPTLSRLQRHFKRYEQENPIIIRVETEAIFALNQQPMFCQYNSGATRCSSHWGGNAPQRGHNTFLQADRYNLSIGSVAEVTFEGCCILPDNFNIGDSPNGTFQRYL